MIIYPAIDIKEGRVVRLLQGDPNQKTVYGSDPVEVAARWQAAGSQWVHIVNLDGALDSDATLWGMIESIAKLGLSIQFGGGLRRASDVQQAIHAGVSRAVLGTAAVENPDMVGELVQEYGADAIIVALDAKQGKVATHGWQTASELTPAALGKMMAERGVRHALYTDIERDGGLVGVNVASTIELAASTGLQVVASGGVRSLDDIRAFQGSPVAGIILGKALYEGAFELADALTLAEG